MSLAITNNGMPASLTTQNTSMEHVIITNKWLGQSKLLANQLVEKLPENSFPQMRTMGSAPPDCKFSGLLRYKHSRGPKGLQFFIYTQRANSDLRVLHCDTYSRDINYPNNTVFPEREETNDLGSVGGGEQLRGDDIQWCYHGQGGWSRESMKKNWCGQRSIFGTHHTLLSLFAFKGGDWYNENVKEIPNPNYWSNSNMKSYHI